MRRLLSHDRAWVVVPLLVFLVSRVASTALLLWLAPGQSAESTAGETVPVVVDPPTYDNVVANWDGQWYRLIAEEGYPRDLPLRPDGSVAQNQWAFYPLYPLIVRLVMTSGLAFGWAASLVSLLLGALAACVLYWMVSRSAGNVTALLTTAALFFYPAALVFQAAYTESLALLLVLLALDALRRRRYGRFVAVSLLLSVTRPIVLPLALVALVVWVVRWRRQSHEPFERREQVALGVAALSCAGTFALWPALVGLLTGQADAYLLTQQTWILDEGTGRTSWLASAVTLSPVVVTVLVGLALVAVLYLVLRRDGRRWGLALRAWPLAYLLYILTATETTSSIIRYLMLAVVVWWPVPEVGALLTTRVQRLTAVAAVIVVGCLAQFVWLRSFFLVLPGWVSWP